MGHRLVSLLAVAFAMALGVASSESRGQAAPPTWVPLDAQPAGTPPSVVVDRGRSTEDQTALNISIHGFYSQQVIIPGIGTFQRVSLNLDGLGASTIEPGRPQLPVLQLTLAIPTDAASAGTPQVTPSNQFRFTSFPVIPAAREFLEEEDVRPVAPLPEIDAAFYAINAVYPATQGEAIGRPSERHGVKIQHVNVYPFRCNPQQQLMTVDRQISIVVPHVGAALPQVELTRRTSRNFAQVVDNWIAVFGDYITQNDVEYKGEYLIICPNTWFDEIEPLADQKTERGYNVTMKSVESIGSNWLSFANEIFLWRTSRPAGSDKYVLLVGDTDRIPLAVNMTTGEQTSDYTYSTPYLTFQLEEPYVNLGRFSVSSGAELTRIVARTIKHIDDPVSSPRWDNVLLVAHNQTENGYVDCIEDIEGVNYIGSNPDFTSLPGNEFFATVNQAISQIEVGNGVVLYRGHGSRFTWSEWDYNDDSLTDADVFDLTMSNGDPSPVVMSVSCANSRIDATSAPTISEWWLRRGGNGASAHVGAIRNTWTSANHTYARSLAFGVYYIPALTPTISWVMDLAGASMAGEHGGDGWENRYLYHLLGDPELPVWRSNPTQTSGRAAPDVARGTGLPGWLPPGQHTLNFEFTAIGDEPVVGAIVSAYKENEVKINGYTNQTGQVSLVVNPTSCGDLVVRAYSDYQDVKAQRFVIPIVILGDADRSGRVDFDDMTTVLANFGDSTTVFGPGDADGSGRVDFDDMTTVLANFGNVCGR